MINYYKNQLVMHTKNTNIQLFHKRNVDSTKNVFDRLAEHNNLQNSSLF